MSNGEGPSEVQEVTGKQFGEVLSGVATTPEAQAILDNLSEVPSNFLDNIAGSTEIPDNIVEAAVQNFFGEGTPASVSLKKMQNSSRDRMNEIKDAFSDTNLAIIKNQLKETISQDEGLRQFFRDLTLDQQDTFISNILETQLMQTIGKQKFIETLVDCESGGPEYQALQKEVTELERIISARRTELRTLNKALDSYEPEITEAKIPDLEGSNEVLKGQIDDANRQVSQLNAQRTVILKKGQRTDEDNAELNRYQNEIAGLNRNIAAAKNDIKENDILKGKAREKKANEQKRDGIEEKLIELREKLTEKKGKLSEAESEFLNKLNAFSAKLETVLPEAAKKALQELNSRVTEANKIALEKKGEEEREQGEREGNMKKRAKGRLLEILASRHIESRSKYFVLKGQRTISRINRNSLRGEFDEIVANPTGASDTIVDRMIVGMTGSEDQEISDYLKDSNNAEFLQELRREMKNDIFTDTVRKGAMHLRLDRGTVETLGTIPEFRRAAMEAIQANKETREMAEKLLGENLGSRSALERIWDKMPLGGVLGIILMLFGGLAWLGGGFGKK